MNLGSSGGRIVLWSVSLGRIIELISGALCVLFFAILVVVMLLGVFARYLMSSPFEWTEELARWLWLAFSFLGINIALRRSEHIGVTFLVDQLPPPLARALDYFVDFLTGVFFIMLIGRAYLMTTNTIMTGAALLISMSWPYLTLLVGACLAFLQLVLRTIGKITTRPGTTFLSGTIAEQNQEGS